MKKFGTIALVVAVVICLAWAKWVTQRNRERQQRLDGAELYVHSMEQWIDLINYSERTTRIPYTREQYETTVRRFLTDQKNTIERARHDSGRQ